jgi:phage gp45-like
MQRGNTLRSTESIGNYISRTTVQSADHTQQWQELTHKVFQDEQADSIEHVHPYGFTSVVQPPSENGQAAEGIVAYLGGDRSHGVVLVVGDRRYRMTGMKNGEVAIHDDQQQSVHITRTGIVITSSMAVTVNAPSITYAAGSAGSLS